MKAQYFQAIEKTFLECTGRGLVISDMDRTYIESWFDSGIPLTVVQSALIESCAGRDSKVRTIALARKRVEKGFSAWKSRQVGGDRQVSSSYADRFDACVLKLEKHVTRITQPALVNALEKAVFELKATRARCVEPTVLQAALEEEELQLYHRLWSDLDAQEIEHIKTLVQAIIGVDDLLESDAMEQRWLKIRNKKLRQRFELPAFEVDQSGA